MLGDRPVRVTLARCWAALSRWARVRFVGSLMWGGLTMGGADLKAQVEQMKVRPKTSLKMTLILSVVIRTQDPHLHILIAACPHLPLKGGGCCTW